MYTKPITYTNFNGQTVTKNFYFNITKAELALRELESDGTWSETLQTIAGSNQGSVVLPEFKKILKWTYGEKSEDGESFVKSDAAWERFENSEPWSVLIMELLSNGAYAAEFINKVLPPDLAAANLEAQKADGFRPGADTSRPTPPVIQATSSPQPGRNNSPRFDPMTGQPITPNQDEGVTRQSQHRADNPFDQQ